jgi:hypothetical protein
MRKLLQISGAALAVAALVGASVALASSQFKQTAKITLTATKAGASTGFKANLASSDPGAPQPQGLKTLTIAFPANTKFNFKSNAVKQCTATDIEIKATGGAACPAKSKIGTGTAMANGAPVIPAIPENAVAYVGSGQIVFLLSPKGPSGQTLVLHGKVSANKVTTEVPVLSAGGLNIVIAELALTVKAVGSGKNAFVTAGKCTNGKFVVKSSFLYQTGAKLALSSSSKCTK